MIGWWLAAAAAGLNSPSVVEVERAYAELAQSKGQWTAFREMAAPGAILLAAQPVDAATWLKDRKDPAVAVNWQPAAAYLSCDGLAAATTGPWQRLKSNGYFVTLWSRTQSSWRWNVDFGDALEKPLPQAPADVSVQRASCKRASPAMLPKLSDHGQFGRGGSPDHSLEWTWFVEKTGATHLNVFVWNGRSYEAVVDRALAPKT